MFSLFKKKDPVCGMKEEKDKGVNKHSEWFCSINCLQQYEKMTKKQKSKKGSCH